MFINKIKLYKNRGLEVSGITSIEIDITKRILVIIGDNGSGKSTIINSINPLPEVQTDYNKGSKQLFINHFNKSYVIKSDFKKGISHSFIEDKEELNTSHKNTIQKDLCESILQYTPFIHNVINIFFKITKMTPNDRRNLFFSAYPYMQEILNKHKKISSIIKSFQSNLKMLNGRKAELIVEQMNQKDIDELTIKYNSYKSKLSEIDKLLYTLNIENNSFKEELSQINLNKDITSEEILNLCMLYKKRIICINRQIDYMCLKDRNVDSIYNLFKTDKTVLTFKIENIENHIKIITKDIEQFESFLKDNSIEDKDQLEQSIRDLTEIINSFDININIPIFTKEQINTLEQTILFEIEKHIQFIISCNRKLFDYNTYTRIKNKITQLSMELINNKSLYDNYLEQFKELKKVTLILPPDDCFNSSCQLKNNSLSTFNNNEERISKIEDILIKLLKEKETKERILQKLYELIYGTETCENSVRYLSQILLNYGVCECIYRGINLIKILNENPVFIINQFKILIKNSINYLTKLEYEQVIKTNLLKLEIINKSPSKEIISKSLIEKQIELQKYFDDYNYTLQELEEKTKLLNSSEEMKKIVDELKSLKEYWETYSKYLILTKSLEWNIDLENKLNNIKNELTDNLIQIETTLRKQENISIRLNQEINPNIESINNKLKKYLLVEQALSPYTGIPRRYMISFINNIIKDINFYVASILNTDIEIELIDEESTNINYLFPIRINGILIPDINKCSKAQSNIIDICLNLALYKQLKLNDNYPLIMDEPDDGFSEGNRTRLLILLSSMVEQGEIFQLIIISHFASMLGGFNNSDIVCLSEENIILPPIYNQNVIIK